jgi:hypothetical protein
LFDRPEFDYQVLSNCFDTTSETAVTKNSIDNCQQACSDNTDCFGVQYSNTTTDCFILSGDLPALEACDVGDSEERSYLRTKSSPYQTLEKTCLRNPIEFDERIHDTEVHECQALCDAHPFCRYFLHGQDEASAFPELRECVLFRAQSIELDDCDNDDTYPEEAPFTGYKEHTAVVNGRTFVDQSTWFGVPKDTFAVIEGLSYQQCASLCDSLEGTCLAFLHTWNYRRESSASGEPLIFTKKRLMKADYKYSGDPHALYLEVDLDKSKLVVGPGGNDDILRKQAIVLNEENADTIQFRIDTRYCVSGGAFAEIQDAFILDDVLAANFLGSPIPSCQRLRLGLCTGKNAIEFVATEKDGRLTLSYTLPNDSANDDAVACVRSIPTSFNFSESSSDRDYIPTGGNGTLVIDPINTCESAVESDVNCTLVQQRQFSPEGNVTPWVTDEARDNCAGVVVNSTTCSGTVLDDASVDLNSTTIQWVETCRKAPHLILTGATMNVSVSATNYTTQEQTLTKTYEETDQTCHQTQKTGLNLLEEMWDYYAGETACGRASDGSEDLQVFSRAYGNGCGFDDDLVAIPSELFALVSDPVLLSNIDFGNCLAGDLSLAGCRSGNAVEWIYVFNGGELFHVDSQGIMMCITRSGDDVVVQMCDTASSLSQQWDYLSVNGTISSPGTSLCLVYTLSNVTLEDCSSIGARWSQYSECSLNSYTSTVKMKLESFENPNQCISSTANTLVQCADAGTWQYFYNTNNSRLELDGSSQCFGKVPGTDEQEAMPDFQLSDLPTGLTECSDPDNAEEKIYWLMTLGGENNNILQWKQVDFAGDLLNLFCFDVPQPMQEVCDDNLDNEAKWRRYGSAGDDTAISVRPELLLQEITDPELLFQFFLYSPDGKLSRILRAKAALLQRDVQLILPFIARTNEFIGDGLDLLDTVSAPAVEEQIDSLLISPSTHS